MALQLACSRRRVSPCGFMPSRGPPRQRQRDHVARSPRPLDRPSAATLMFDKGIANARFFSVRERGVMSSGKRSRSAP
jgi:hypothetical protein